MAKVPVASRDRDFEMVVLPPERESHYQSLTTGSGNCNTYMTVEKRHVFVPQKEEMEVSQKNSTCAVDIDPPSLPPRPPCDYECIQPDSQRFLEASRKGRKCEANKGFLVQYLQLFSLYQ